MSLDKVQPGDARVKTLLNDLNSAAIASATGVSWQEKAYDWFNFDSSVRSTAIILNALARLDPKSALSSNVVRWLMVARAGPGLGDQPGERLVGDGAQRVAHGGWRDGSVLHLARDAE